VFRARVFLSVSFGELRAAGALGSNAIAPPRQEPEAIVLYLVYPIVASRRPFEATFAEIGSRLSRIAEATK